MNLFIKQWIAIALVFSFDQSIPSIPSEKTSDHFQSQALAIASLQSLNLPLHSAPKDLVFREMANVITRPSSFALGMRPDSAMRLEFDAAYQRWTKAQRTMDAPNQILSQELIDILDRVSILEMPLFFGFNFAVVHFILYEKIDPNVPVEVFQKRVRAGASQSINKELQIFLRQHYDIFMDRRWRRVSSVLWDPGRLELVAAFNFIGNRVLAGVQDLLLSNPSLDAFWLRIYADVQTIEPHTQWNTAALLRQGGLAMTPELLCRAA